MGKDEEQKNEDTMRQFDALQAEFKRRFPQGTITGQDVRVSLTPITFPASLWKSSPRTPDGNVAGAPFSHGCFLVTEYTTWFLVGPIFPQAAAYSTMLLPGQAIRCRVGNLADSRGLASMYATLPETLSGGTLASFEDALAAEATRQGDPSKPPSGILPVIAGQRPVHVGTEISCGAGVKRPDLAGHFQVERDASDALLTAALQRHVQEKVAARHVEITESPELPAESEPGSRVEEITNHSQVAPMTAFFLQPAREIQAIRAVTDIHLLFYDGSGHRIVRLEEFDAAVVRYLARDHAEAPAALEDFRRVIRQAAAINDYRGRVTSLLEDGGPTGFHVTRDTYFTLLQERLDDQDAALLPVKQHVRGVVISITPFTVLVQSYLIRCVMGAPCVDDATLRQHEADARARG